MFAGALLGQIICGIKEYNKELIEQGAAAVTMSQYLHSGHFIESTFENWQSEFLSVFAIIGLSIYLRQIGSPQSKPVVAPHNETGE